MSVFHIFLVNLRQIYKNVLPNCRQRVLLRGATCLLQAGATRQSLCIPTGFFCFSAFLFHNFFQKPISLELYYEKLLDDIYNNK